MKLKKLAAINSGYISRTRIEPDETGSLFLFQAKDVNTEILGYDPGSLIRFSPALSAKDWLLKKGDILFMARGANNYSILINKLPGDTVAAASFFIIRVPDGPARANYLCWYLNQGPVEEYLKRYSGRGVHMPVVRRKVLEEIDIPIPSPAVQKTVVETARLVEKEQRLYAMLAEKRKEWIMECCLKAARKDQKKG
ncbi:MAG: restriction endonuclease subunit S [Desulfobacterales bacterium]|nr:restriction endonuclease subunit S [Desulfobacterales bacterium]